MLHLVQQENSHWLSHLHFEHEFCLDCDWTRVDLGQSDKVRARAALRLALNAVALSPCAAPPVHCLLSWCTGTERGCMVRLLSARRARQRMPGHPPRCCPGEALRVVGQLVLRCVRCPPPGLSPMADPHPKPSRAQTEITKVWGDQNKRWKLFITRFFNCEVCYGRMDQAGLAACQASFREHFEFASCRAHRCARQGTACWGVP